MKTYQEKFVLAKLDAEEQQMLAQPLVEQPRGAQFHEGRPVEVLTGRKQKTRQKHCLIR